MTNEDRQLLLSYAFSNISLEAGKVTVSYTSAFEFLATWVPAVNEHFELENSVDLKEQNSSVLFCAPDKIRTCVGILREVYSLLHLTTLPPTRVTLIFLDIRQSMT